MVSGYGRLTDGLILSAAKMSEECERILEEVQISGCCIQRKAAQTAKSQYHEKARNHSAQGLNITKAVKGKHKVPLLPELCPPHQADTYTLLHSLRIPCFITAKVLRVASK